MIRWVVGVLIVMSALQAENAAAQPAPGRIEVDGGVGWIGPISFAPVPANEATLGGGTRTVFNTSSRLDGSIGAVANVGFRLKPPVQLEANFAYHPTHLTAEITGDSEGVANTSVDSSVTQYALGGDVLLQRGKWQRRRVAPFAVAGAAYLRQVSEGRTVVQSGASYSAGGGIYISRERRGGGLKSTGLKLEARALALRDGMSLDGNTHVTPAVTASLFARF